MVNSPVVEQNTCRYTLMMLAVRCLWIFLLQLNVYACLKGFDSTKLNSVNDFKVPQNIQSGDGEYGVEVNYKLREM